MKRIFRLTAMVLASACMVAAAQNEGETVQTSVHHIDLPHYMPYLPPGPNRDVFAARCLSCHSMRYITTQPQMPQAKWEAEATKMIKTYGAPIPETDVPSIAQYAVFLQNAPQEQIARTVSGSGALPALGAAGDANHGKEVFAKACVSCHGVSGKGDGGGMPNLIPRAADLTAARFDPRAVQSAVLHGVPGAAMPAFTTLSANDVNDVIAYVGSLAPKEAEPPAAAGEAKAMFESACASCHGKEGAADGFNAPTLPRSPTNFKLIQPTRQRAIGVITDGIAGTSMPSWKSKFNDAQRAELADYVRSLYAGGK